MLPAGLPSHGSSRSPTRPDRGPARALLLRQDYHWDSDACHREIRDYLPVPGPARLSDSGSDSETHCSGQSLSPLNVQLEFKFEDSETGPCFKFKLKARLEKARSFILELKLKARARLGGRLDPGHPATFKQVDLKFTVTRSVTGTALLVRVKRPTRKPPQPPGLSGAARAAVAEPSDSDRASG